MSPAPTPEQSWILLAQSPEYRQLLTEKRRFIVPATVFFVVYYFSLLVLVGWCPKAMSAPVVGDVNVAYLFALSQFFMAWTLAFLYVRKASQWDRLAAELVNRVQPTVAREPSSAPQGVSGANAAGS